MWSLTFAGVRIHEYFWKAVDWTVCRIASLEKNGIISEEDQASQSALSEALNGLEVFRTAIELQVEKIEKRVVNAEILAQKLENAKSDSRSTKHVEGKFEAQCAEQKQAINALQSKIEEYEVAAIQARKVCALIAYFSNSNCK